MEFRLLSAFRGLFDGVKYEHRRSHLGDYVATFLYEDLYALGRSAKLTKRVEAGNAVVNVENVAVGRTARRGDGTFGEVVPSVAAVVVPGFAVPRGRIAAVEIGAETKILAKAMIKQIDRVVNDLKAQVVHFRASNPRAICAAIVGVNHAGRYVSFEGRRKFPTDGQTYKHPIQEAAAAIDRLSKLASPSFDEFVILKYKASNTRPYQFEWLDEAETAAQYSAALTRISREYETRF